MKRQKKKKKKRKGEKEEFCLENEPGAGGMVGLYYFAFMLVGQSSQVSGFLPSVSVGRFPPLPFIISVIYETNTLIPAVQLRSGLNCGLSR